MRKMMLVSLAVASLSVAPSLAEAGALTAPSSNGITLVEGGCGPGGFRAGNGACYRRPPPRAEYYRRECPPRMHMSRFGCRPNY